MTRLSLFGDHSSINRSIYLSGTYTKAWEDDEATSLMWQLVDRGDLAELKHLINADSDLVHIRSADGRGPLFWAYEYEAYDIVQFLLETGLFASLGLCIQALPRITFVLL